MPLKHCIRSELEDVRQRYKQRALPKIGKKLGVDNVNDLLVEWEFVLAEGASGTPAVEGKHVYIGDWGGNIYKLDVDKKRQQIYVATGNNYSSPQTYFDCIAVTPPDEQLATCNPEDNYFDSVVALDMKTGKVNWANRVHPYDTWIVDCSPILSGGFGNGTCGSYAIGPEGVPGGPDFDFGQTPILHKVTVGSGGKGSKGSKKSGKSGKSVTSSELSALTGFSENDLKLFPDRVDENAIQLDLRTENTWTTPLAQTNLSELLDVTVINYLAPFVTTI